MHRICDHSPNVVSNTCFAKTGLETLNHASLDVDAKQAPGRADGPACFSRVVSGSRPEFDDRLSGSQHEVPQRPPRRHEDRAQGIQEIAGAFGWKRGRPPPLVKIGVNKTDEMVARKDGTDDQGDAKDSAHGLTAVLRQHVIGAVGNTKEGVVATNGRLALRLPDLEVVSRAFPGVGEDFVGLVDLYEALLGAGLRVTVRAVPHSQTAVRLFDLVPTGDTVDAQNLVVISHHNSA